MHQLVMFTPELLVTGFVTSKAAIEKKNKQLSSLQQENITLNKKLKELRKQVGDVASRTP